MGQRLVIDICNNERVLVNCYWHWSGYTSSALDLTEKIISKYDDAVSELAKRGIADERLAAVKALEGTGASLTTCARKLFKEIYPNEQFEERELDRNEGLIELDDSQMEDSRGCGEEFVSVNISSRRVNFEVIHNADEEDIGCYLDIDMADMEYEEFDEAVSKWKESTEDVSGGMGDVFDVSFDDFETYRKRINDANYIFKWGNDIYVKIE